MKLADILDSPQAHHVNPRPVKFRIAGVNSRGEQVKAEEASACFRFVSEQERAEAYRDGDAEARKLYGSGVEPSLDRVVAERNYCILFRILRDADDPKTAFAASVLQLKNVLVLDEAKRLFDEYETWVAEEFPDTIDEETFAKLVEDAKKKSLSDLLTSYGFKAIRRALPSLASHSG